MAGHSKKGWIWWLYSVGQVKIKVMSPGLPGRGWGQNNLIGTLLGCKMWICFNIDINNCHSTFLKILTFSQNTDQIQTSFKGFSEKVCITDQNFYTPLCHHCITLVGENFEKKGKSHEYNFFERVISWIIFKRFFETLSALEICHVTLSSGVVNKRFKSFEVFESWKLFW